MDNINILEEVGLGEVSRKTHIEVIFLKRILNKEFDKLQKVSTLGFIKILKREYNLELDEWLKEFEIYLKEQGEDAKNNLKNPIFEKEEEGNTLKKMIWILAILVLIVGLFFAFDGLNYIKYTQDDTQNKESFEQTGEIEETQSKLENLEKIQKNENIPLVLENNKSSHEQINETNLSQESLNIQEHTEEQNKNSQIQEKPQNDLLAEKEELKLNSENEILIVPTRTLWIGLVNLQTKSKKQFLTAKNLKIDLSKPQLLVTGHGDLSIEKFDGSKKISESVHKKYYHITEKQIINITRAEFIKLNGGNPW